MGRDFEWVVLATFLACSWAAPAFAQLPLPPKPDLTLRLPDDPDTWIRPTLRVDTAWFFQTQAWAGNDRELAGDAINEWGEIGVIPGLEGQLSLGDWGTLGARVSGVYATTQVGLDAAGSNLDKRSPDRFRLEDAYLRWRSGELFPSLGKDALELSVGAQSYQLDTGFLFWDGATDGGRRGGYWIALRQAFRFSAIARLKTGPLLAEAMFLSPNDQPNTSTKLAGINLEWSFDELGRIGAGYWSVYDSDDDRRDGLHVFDLRGRFHPLRSLPGLGIAGEIVREDNGSKNKSWGGYGEVSYDFASVRLKPYASYRFAFFTGDDGSGSNNAFDPLFYGFSDWNQWYLGELAGEYVATNRNIDVHVLRLRASPVPSVTAQLFYLYFRLDQFPDQIQPRPPTDARAALIEDKDLAHEVDFIVDWSATDYLTFSAVAAVLMPLSGGEDFFGDDDTWAGFMLYAKLEF